MAPRRRLLVALLPLLGALLATLAVGQEEPGREAGPTNASTLLAEALTEQVSALNAEEPERVMALFHPDAPNLEEVRASLVGMFRAQDLRFTLDEQHFVGVDGRYAYVRCLQTTRAPASAAGPPAVSRSEQLFVFRRLGPGWRFWTSAVLESGPG